MSGNQKHLQSEKFMRKSTTAGYVSDAESARKALEKRLRYNLLNSSILSDEFCLSCRDRRKRHVWSLGKGAHLIEFA